MTDWRPGMACLVRGERPGYVQAVAGERATVRFLVGAAPPGMPDVVAVRTGALVRPPGARHLDSRATRHWTTKRPWRGDDLIRLRDAWPETTQAALAVALGRSEAACKLAMHRWWGVRRSDPRAVLSLRAVARVLGVDDHRVRALIRWGYLRGRRSGIAAGPNVRWRITDTALEAFLAHHPAQYDRRRIAPGPYRALADDVWSRDPLLTVPEVADRVGLVPAIVLQHVAAGRIRGVWSRGGAAGSNRRWLVATSALAAFAVAVPGEVFAARVEEAVHALGLLTAVEAAGRLGLHRSSVNRLIRRGRLAAEPVLLGQRTVFAVRLEPASVGEATGR